jgi:CRP-like cAMP-binding protein
MFLVFSGRVSLNVGIDEAFARCYGPGALIGLPATLSKRTYSMTATVIEDAELGFLPPQVLESLMRDNADLCQELLTILNQRMLQIQQLQRALLHKEKELPSESPGFTSPEERRVT